MKIKIFFKLANYCITQLGSTRKNVAKRRGTTPNMKLLNHYLISNVFEFNHNLQFLENFKRNV